MQARCTGWGRELDSPSIGRDFGKKIKAAKELAQERHEEGKWQEGLCYTQHFLKTVSAKALNQCQDVKSPRAARSPSSCKLPNTWLWSAGVHHPFPKSQSCKHRQTLSACLEQIAPIAQTSRERHEATPRATDTRSCKKQQAKCLSHFLWPAPASQDTCGLWPQPRRPWCRHSSRGWRGCACPTTTACLPPKPPPRLTGNKPAVGRAESSPTAQDPAPCRVSSSQTPSIPDCCVRSSRADRKKKMSSSPFLAVSISSSVQRELSFISREAGKEEGKESSQLGAGPSKPGELRDAQTPKPCPTLCSPEAQQDAVQCRSASAGKAVTVWALKAFPCHSNPSTASSPGRKTSTLGLEVKPGGLRVAVDSC